MRTSLPRLAVVILPALLTLLLLVVGLRGDLSQFVPAEFDEIGNWHETYTFSRVGFDGGYYTFDEAPAPVSWSHFDTHGLFYTGLTAIVARLFGWHPATMLWVNLIAVTGALELFVAVTRPTAGRALLMAALVGTSWALLLYLPSNWQESLHHAIGIVLAAVFYVLLRDGADAAPRGVKLGGCALLLVASWVRLSWAFVFVPYLLIVLPRRPLVALLAAGALIALGGAIFWSFAAPYSLNFTYQFSQTWRADGLGAALKLFTDHTLYNFNQFNQGHVLEVAERYVYLALLIALALAGTRFGRRWRLRTTEISVHLLNLGIVLLAFVFIYDLYLWRDYRGLSAHLLLSLLLLAAFARLRPLLIGVVAVHLLLAPAFWGEYTRLRTAQLQPDRAAMDAFRDATAPYLAYRADAPNAWCNTVLVSGFGPELLTLPPGVGFTAIINPVFVRFPVKSRWLLLRPDIYAALADGLHAERVASTSLGDLYRNMDAGCG